MIATNYFSSLVAIFFIATLISCSENKFKEKAASDKETMNSGKLDVIVDESIWEFIEPAQKMYLEKYTNVEISDTVASARTAMINLFGGNKRVAIIARDYLPDEMQRLKENGMEPYQRVKAVNDGLVFAVNKDFPLRYTQDSILKNIFQKGHRLEDYHDSINFKIHYFIKERNSSEHSNFERFILEFNDRKRELQISESTEEILQKVAEDKSNIGIVYLSQVSTADTSLGIKMLPIAYVDSTGKFNNPVPIHQSWLVRNRYPYEFGWWLYQKKDNKDLAYWYSQYIATERKAQKHFASVGVEPEFMRFNLIQEKKK
jgi:ABC-type phosphate transport system substrate-binding protein